MTNFPQRGPVSEALRDWCRWIYLQADMSLRATEAKGGGVDFKGRALTWRDYCGKYERRLIESAMWEGIFEPADPPQKPRGMK